MNLSRRLAGPGKVCQRRVNFGSGPYFGLWGTLWGAVTDCGRCRAWWLAWRHEDELIAVS